MKSEDEIRTQIRKAFTNFLPDITDNEDTFTMGYREALYWVLGE